MNNTRVINQTGGEYPKGLLKLHDPPQRLFAAGSQLDFDRPVLAVVGSRKPTAYGRQVVEELIDGLNGSNTLIVSGLALGIDGLAHRAALKNSLTTAAILPSGLDRIYPASHRQLAADIARHGALLSEYPLGTQAAKYHFPARNRIIAACSDAVLVIEAAERSGTLITAEHALDVGVTVLAVPGPITSRTSDGTNRLIQLGAGLIRSAEDLRAELNLRPTQARTVKVKNQQEQTVVDSLRRGPRSANDLQQETSIDIRELNHVLTSLEVSGVVRTQGSNIWSL